MKEMTDRELLETAAKAAGIEINGLADKFVAQHDLGKDALCIRNNKGGDSLWNPLKDDGDALRLAVKLKMVVDCVDSICVVSFGRVEGKYTFIGDVVEEYKNSDPYAATRGAVVRAAAEIGRTK